MECMGQSEGIAGPTAAGCPVMAVRVGETAWLPGAGFFGGQRMELSSTHSRVQHTALYSPACTYTLKAAWYIIGQPDCLVLVHGRLAEQRLAQKQLATSHLQFVRLCRTFTMYPCLYSLQGVHAITALQCSRWGLGLCSLSSVTQRLYTRVMWLRCSRRAARTSLT